MARPWLALYPYREGDIDRFTPRADFAVEKAAVGWDWAQGAPSGRCWTLTNVSDPGPRVLGVGGVFDAGNDGLHAWAILAELTPRQWVAARAIAKRALAGIELFQAPARISATARTTIPGAAPLLRRLGFSPRGTVADPRLPDVVYELMVRRAA